MENILTWWPLALSGVCVVAWLMFLRFLRSRVEAGALRTAWEEQAKAAHAEVDRLRQELAQREPPAEALERHTSGLVQTIRTLEEGKAGLQRHNAALADAAHALQKERDDWKRLYMQALAEGSATQSLLYDALQRARAALAKHGAKIPPENGLDRLVEAARGHDHLTPTQPGTQAK